MQYIKARMSSTDPVSSITNCHRLIVSYTDPVHSFVISKRTVEPTGSSFSRFFLVSSLSGLPAHSYECALKSPAFLFLLSVHIVFVLVVGAYKELFSKIIVKIWGRWFLTHADNLKGFALFFNTRFAKTKCSPIGEIPLRLYNMI